MPSASVPPPAAEVLTLDTSRDPELGLKVLAWLTVAFSILQIVAFSFGRDQSIYAVIGEGLLRGQVPYRDLWDFKPPGIFFIYAASFALFGQSMMAPRLVEAVCLFALVLGMRRLGGTLFGSRTAGLLGGALAALLHAQLDFWHTGQPETFGGALTIAVLVLLTSPRPLRRAWLHELLAGVLLGFAFVLKPPLAGVALPLAIYLAFTRAREGRPWRARLSPSLFLAGGGLLPLAALGLWFASRGAWSDLLWTFFDFTPGYTKLGWAGRSPLPLLLRPLMDVTFGLSLLLGAGFTLGVVAQTRSRQYRPAFFLILGALLVQLLGITAQGKFFHYHYGASIPLVALVAGDGFHRLWRRYAVGSFVGHMAFALLLLALTLFKSPVNDVPRGFWSRSVKRLHYLLGAGRTISREELDRDLYRAADFDLDADRRVAAELRRTLPPDAALYVWGFEPAIYWMSELRPASRFIYDVPQRALWESNTAREILLNELERTPPAAVVVQHGDVFPHVTGNRWDSAQSLPHFPELERWLNDKYELGSSVEDFDIYFPRSPAAPVERPR